MKKGFAAILSLSLLSALVFPAMAADTEPPMVISPAPEWAVQEEEQAAPGFPIQIDGKEIDAKACVMVPLRPIAEALGFTVEWNNGTVTVTGPERYAQLTIGEDRYFAAPTREGLMGASLFSLGCAPCLSNGSTYVPAELFDAILGCQEGTITLEGDTVHINTGTVQIPNPFSEQTTLAEAAKAVGFELMAPETVNGSARRGIQTMGKEMIQVFYGDEGHEVCIRKAPGSGDISGDYTDYAQITTVTVNGVDVTVKGENNLAHLAIWTSGGYTYSILARAGVSHDDMTALIRTVQ